MGVGRKSRQKKDEKRRKEGHVAEQIRGRVTNARKKERGKRKGGKVELHLPPLGLISFCILCCVPAG